jgi:hypothetical protein
MAAITVLGPGGYPKPRYGSFAGRVPSVPRIVSVLGPGGYPRPPYGSFAGKAPSSQRVVSTLGPGGYPRPPYAFFAGFSGKVPSTGGVVASKPFLATMGKLLTIGS